AREKLGWIHKTPVRELAREMVREDIQMMQTSPIMKDA
ncbi:MAG TPA: GDP-mannose 4,6-dehydratase, partial [Hyphomonas sp.]|nr:GDP-mannose 4,6-dehydratase [Hyphomonas sp.]